MSRAELASSPVFPHENSDTSHFVSISSKNIPTSSMSNSTMTSGGNASMPSTSNSMDGSVPATSPLAVSNSFVSASLSSSRTPPPTGEGSNAVHYDQLRQMAQKATDIVAGLRVSQGFIE